MHQSSQCLFCVVREQYRHHRDHERVLGCVAQPLTAQRLHKRSINNVAVLRNRNAHSSCSIGRCLRDQVPQLRGGAVAGGGVAVAQGKGDGGQRCKGCDVGGGGGGGGSQRQGRSW
jgi:hypothetical protein